MKRKRGIVKNKTKNVKLVSLEGTEVHENEEDIEPEPCANKIYLNENESSRLVDALCAIDQRLQKSENVWKLFFEKLLEIRTNLESQKRNTSGTSKYVVKYEACSVDSDTDLENTIHEECNFTNFPINTVEDFLLLNQNCGTNTESEQKLYNYFSNLPSEHQTLRKWCETNLSLLLTDSVAIKFSWNGSKLIPTIKEPNNVFDGGLPEHLFEWLFKIQVFNPRHLAPNTSTIQTDYDISFVKCQEILHKTRHK